IFGSGHLKKDPPPLKKGDQSVRNLCGIPPRVLSSPTQDADAKAGGEPARGRRPHDGYGAVQGLATSRCPAIPLPETPRRIPLLSRAPHPVRPFRVGPRKRSRDRCKVFSRGLPSSPECAACPARRLGFCPACPPDSYG